MSPSVLNTVKYLNLYNNKVVHVSDEFLRQVIESHTLKWLDLRQNDLKTISIKFKDLNNLEKIWLSGNPFHCDCEMTWMIEFLNNKTTSSGNQVVVDYREVKCYNGKMKGLPIYVLNQVIMGCYPAKMTLGQKLGISTGSVLGLVLVLVVFLVARNPREVKFFMYYYFKVDTVPKVDQNENVENMEYDAFFCYR